MANKENKKTKKYTYAMGRRKKAVATIRLYEGKGDSIINDNKAEEVYPTEREQTTLFAPLVTLELKGKYFFTAKTEGGGLSGQLDALQLALARALEKVESDHRKALKEEGYLRVDDRVKERKKPGRRKARKKQQYSKR